VGNLTEEIIMEYIKHDADLLEEFLFRAYHTSNLGYDEKLESGTRALYMYKLPESDSDDDQVNGYIVGIVEEDVIKINPDDDEFELIRQPFIVDNMTKKQAKEWLE
jgi:hypothetical protein